MNGALGRRTLRNRTLPFFAFGICLGVLFSLAGCTEEKEIVTNKVPTVSASSEVILSPDTKTSDALPADDSIPPQTLSADNESPPTPQENDPENVNALPSLDELLLFYPAKYPAGNWEPTEIQFEDVWFEADDGTRLHGWYCPANEPRAVLLYAHGNAGNLAHRSPLLLDLQKELRVSVLIFDYRGYGRSAGKPTVAGILEDARAARTILVEKAGVSEETIVLMGRSLGGAVAVQLASEKPPRGLILESTFSSFRNVAAHHYPKLAWLVPRNKLDSLSLMKEYTGPLLISHGDADRTIPYAQGQALFDAAQGPKKFVTIPNGDHNSPQSAEYDSALNEFLNSLKE